MAWVNSNTEGSLCYAGTLLFFHKHVQYEETRTHAVPSTKMLCVHLFRACSRMSSVRLASYYSLGGPPQKKGFSLTPVDGEWCAWYRYH